MSIIREFEIIRVLIHHNRGTFIFAKHLGSNHDFKVDESAILGDLMVYNYKDMQPIYDENGKVQPDIFVFRPFDIQQLFDKRFTEGDRVKLKYSE